MAALAQINEKNKHARPASRLAFLLHSCYGIDHYPDYLLNRFAIQDGGAIQQADGGGGSGVVAGRREHGAEATLDRLLHALEQQAAMVRAAKAAVATRAALLARYVPLHAAPDMVLDPALARALRDFAQRPAAAPAAAALHALLTPSGDGDGGRVYQFRLFRPEFCAALLGEMRHWCAWRDAQARADAPGADLLNFQIVPCDHFGAAWQRVFDALLARVVRVLGGLLYPGVGGGALDWRWPYVVGYSPTPSAARNATRQALVPHTDDSEVTLNVNLAAPPRGGRLLFRGLRNSAGEGRVGAVVTPVPGSAVLHLGQHLHEVEAVGGGERHALIVWCRSMGRRAAAAPGGGGEGGGGGGLRARVCPCCIKNRREAGCICAAAWN